MKKYSILFTLLAVFVVSCHNDVTVDEGTSIDIENRYIIFGAGTSTRGALIVDQYLDRDFNVLGYQYPGEWEFANSTLLPNVFDNSPQKVEFEGSYYSYGTPKAWTGNKYSFFSYYPTDNDQIQLFDNGSTKRGIPYITYTLPDSNDPRDLIDILTGCFIDTGVSYSTSNTVTFSMSHRLSAIDICARNGYKLDHDNNVSTPDVAVNLVITNLEINLTNLNTTAKIYLDNSTATVPSDVASRSYQIIGAKDWGKESIILVPNNDLNKDVQLITTQDAKKETSLLLIPQTDNLHGTITFTYKKQYQGQDIGGTVTETKDIVFNSALKEKNRYYIELYFTSEAVTVKIDNTNAWEDLKKEVEHDFE